MSGDVVPITAPRPAKAPTEPIDLGGLLDRISAFISDYVVIGADELKLLTLFVAHTWIAEAAEATPYVIVGSA